ncbi:Melanopsin-A [Varanus komodoensis]|nr:Melanopsin-A [Varanus komodoensis]
MVQEIESEKQQRLNNPMSAFLDHRQKNKKYSIVVTKSGNVTSEQQCDRGDTSDSDLSDPEKDVSQKHALASLSSLGQKGHHGTSSLPPEEVFLPSSVSQNSSCEPAATLKWPSNASSDLSKEKAFCIVRREPMDCRKHKSYLRLSPKIFQRGILCPSSVSNCSRIVDVLNDTEANAYKLMDLAPFALRTEPTMLNLPSPFSTVDVPGHAHYAIAAVILAVGITGTLGNLLVIYAFCRSRGLRTPTNMFIINLAMSDFLMSVTQCPLFFINSLNKRWIFGEKGCELYAFCGALFGIASMITLTVIALDRYFVITRPLASIGVMSKKKALLILLGVWLYSLAWSLPPFFGWSK